MTFSALIAALAVATCVVAILYHWLCRFSERMPNDVPPFLYKVDLELLNGAFHPEAEEGFRKKNTAAEFKKVQWKRLHVAIHFCNLLTSNSRVIQGFARFLRKRSWDLFHPELQSEIRELKVVCMSCRMAAFVVRFRLRCWLLRMTLLPWMEPPTFKALLRIGSADMITFYHQVRTRLETISLSYGEPYHTSVMDAL
jgi:hypothetical protein